MRIPSASSVTRTTTEVAEAEVISRAASRIEVSGSHVTAPARTRPPTACSAGSPGVSKSADAEASDHGSSNDLATYLRPAGRASRSWRDIRPRAGSRACPRPRAPRSRRAGPTASTRGRTAHLPRGRSSTRPSWMISTAPVRTTRRCCSGASPLRVDRRPGSVKLHLERSRHPFHGVGGEGVERRVLAQKAGHFGRRGRHARTRAVAAASGFASRLISFQGFSPIGRPRKSVARGSLSA